ncbi:MAG: hypothetical protein GZ091_18785, partial [Paludibacter sp.]|nr:hypothetical protein [Paludibacter sp.]
MKKNYLLSFKTIFLFLMLICFSSQSFAAHFRYGNASWKRISEDATTVTIGVTVNISWRINPQNVTFTIENGTLIDGGTSFTIVTTNTTDPIGGWINSYGYSEITLNKTAGVTTLRFFGGAKISNSSNNANGSWNVFTTINTSAAGNAPVSSMPAVINMPVNITSALYNIAASDPDPGTVLTYRFATAAESNGPLPAGLAIDGNTGQLSFDTAGKTVGQLYNVIVVVTDNDGNSILIDFLVNIIQGSTAPDWDYTVTPANNTVYNIIVGQQLTFKVKATDSDAASTVKIGVSGLPNYIDASVVFSPNLPAQGNLQSESVFTWTPTAVARGKTVALNFLAQDNTGMGSSTSLLIKVNSEAAPEFLTPTPSQNSIRQVVPGIFISDVIKAQSTIGSPTSIVFAKIPVGASLDQTIPTLSADPSELAVNWTPTAANFGLNVFEFQAAITSDATIFSSRLYTVVVNTPSFFESTALTTATVGQNYSYTVNINDIDIALGDQIELEGITIPSWLTLVKQSEKVYLLEGTPTIGDIGINAVSLKSEDIYHHDPSSDNTYQNFDIIVKNAQTISFSPLSDKNCGDLPFILTASSSSALDVTYTSSDPSIVSIVADLATILKKGSVTISATQNGNDDYDVALQVDQNLNIIDDIKPVVLTKNIAVQLDATGKTSIVVADVDDGATDNCGIESVEFSTKIEDLELIKNGDFSANTNEWILSGNDFAGGFKNEGGTNGGFFIVNAGGDPFSDPSISQEIRGLTVGETYTITGDYRSFYGNYVIGQLTFGVDVDGVQIVELPNPGTTWTNFSTTFIASSISQTIRFRSEINGTDVEMAIDNISIQVPNELLSTDLSFNCSNIGDNTVTLKVTDNSGNVATATATVKVEDKIAPVVLTKNITIQLNAAGSGSIVAADVNNGSTDACGISLLELDKTAFTCANIGDNTVTLTVTDNSGNVSSK